MSWNRPPPRVRQYEGKTAGIPGLPYSPSLSSEGVCTPDPKILPKRDPQYRRWVASLPCTHCDQEGRTQCAHADEGKGMGTKSSDETCYPACVECHAEIGSTGTWSREDRRNLEAIYGARTRLRAMSEGVFPKGWM